MVQTVDGRNLNQFPKTNNVMSAIGDYGRIVQFGNGLPKLEPLIDMKDEDIDYTVNLLGNRWLEREQGAFIYAPSGIGKSGIAIQSSFLWGCGRKAFGISCKGALRQIVIQHEDSRKIFCCLWHFKEVSYIH